MPGYCSRCGRESELLAGPDGRLYCDSCLIQAASPRCIDCVKCYQRRCGDAIYACPFCHGTPESYTPEAFQRKVKEERILQPLRVDEKCERCGGTLAGRAFILHGKALCRDCLLYEQDRWEIVPGKPGKYGTRVKIVIERPPANAGPEYANHRPGIRNPEAETGGTNPGRSPPGFETENRNGRKLLNAIGVDPENPPPDPFTAAKTMGEGRMPDDSCKNCEAYRLGRKSGKSLGAPGAKGSKKS